MISHAHGTHVQNTPISIEDLVKLGVSTRVLSELAPMVADFATASADIVELSFFHVKRRDPKCQVPIALPRRRRSRPA